MDPPDAVKGGAGNCQRFVTDRPTLSPPILSRIFAGPMVVQVVGEGPGGKGRKRDVICLALFLLIRDWSVKMEWNLHEAGRVDTGRCTGGGVMRTAFLCSLPHFIRHIHPHFPRHRISHISPNQA